MARDDGLETLVREAVGGEPGLSERPMFGGLVWLHYGNMLCATRHDGAMVRLGKGNDAWALAVPGVTQMSAGHKMPGWVWVDPEVFGDDHTRERLLDAALAFVRALPPK